MSQALQVRTALPARAAPGQGRLCVLPGSARTVDSLCPARQRQDSGQFCVCQATPDLDSFVPCRQRQVGDGSVSCQAAPGQGRLYAPTRAAPEQGTSLYPAKQRQDRELFCVPPGGARTGNGFVSCQDNGRFCVLASRDLPGQERFNGQQDTTWTGDRVFALSCLFFPHFSDYLFF